MSVAVCNMYCTLAKVLLRAYKSLLAKSPITICRDEKTKDFNDWLVSDALCVYVIAASAEP